MEQRINHIIADTIVWCRKRARLDDPMHSLRSRELKPAYNFYTDDHWDGKDANFFSARDQWFRMRREAANDVAQRRTLQIKLRGYKRDEVLSEDYVTSGRFLLGEMDDGLRDGLSTSGSRGLFDEAGIPPWDSWITYVIMEQNVRIVSRTSPKQKIEFLVCWIPPEFVALADQGIASLIMPNYAWADNPTYDDVPFVQDLRNIYKSIV